LVVILVFVGGTENAASFSYALATLFPNEASLLRLVTAMVAEISDEWEIGRAYLVMESE